MCCGASVTDKQQQPRQQQPEAAGHHARVARHLPLLPLVRQLSSVSGITTATATTTATAATALPRPAAGRGGPGHSDGPCSPSSPLSAEEEDDRAWHPMRRAGDSSSSLDSCITSVTDDDSPCATVNPRPAVTAASVQRALAAAAAVAAAYTEQCRNPPPPEQQEEEEEAWAYESGEQPHHHHQARTAPSAPAAAAAAAAVAARAAARAAPGAASIAGTVKTLAAFAGWPTDGGRYRYLRTLGQGSYAVVAEALDTVTGQRVAVKRITKIFHERSDALRVYRELLLLARLSAEPAAKPAAGAAGGQRAMHHHPNLAWLVNVMLPASYSEFTDLVLVFEAAETSLGHVLGSSQRLHDAHVQILLYQLLRALEYLRGAGVMHRDIKPYNVLVNADCSLKLCDLGLARIHLPSDPAPTPAAAPPTTAATTTTIRPHWQRGAASDASDDDDDDSMAVDEDPEAAAAAAAVAAATADWVRAAAPGQLSKHVVTRWYRAPELILRQPYTAEVDTWSVGCLAAELLAKVQQPFAPARALFPGRGCFPLSRDPRATRIERDDQLRVVFRVLGVPGPATLRKMNLAPDWREYVACVARMEGGGAQGQQGPQGQGVEGEEECKGGEEEEDAAEAEAQAELWRTMAALRNLYPSANPMALDLVARMLAYDPARRLSLDAALAHPYLQQARATYHDGEHAIATAAADPAGPILEHDKPPRAVVAALWTPRERVALEGGAGLSGEEIKAGMWDALHAFRATRR